jgi:perosamine synthetase
VVNLTFQARKYPKGSEVVMMGINIPDMVQIIKEHGLVPVPVDYDIETMSPKSFDEIKEAITDKVSTLDLNHTD